jgi:hypothetical protein
VTVNRIEERDQEPFAVRVGSPDSPEQWRSGCPGFHSGADGPCNFDTSRPNSTGSVKLLGIIRFLRSWASGQFGGHPKPVKGACKFFPECLGLLPDVRQPDEQAPYVLRLGVSASLGRAIQIQILSSWPARNH